ncbi:VOC family protein [Streptosporangium sp. NPDC051022]|uniref:VOC family protein n=1 Tax=Streptosporangium sp. NPDC051022 TaxID=3155752 RepID=UPI003442F198
MIARQSQIVVDCASPARLAVFWGRLLGGTSAHRDPGWSYVDPPGGLRLAFQRVPEPKAGKNRLHLDLAVDDVPAAAEAAAALGGECVGGLMRDEVGAFQVMRDPEGNEFCLVGP